MPTSRDGTFLQGPNLPCAPVGAFKNQIILIDQTSGTDNGVWLDMSDVLNGTIEITKVGTAASFSFQLFGSNAQAKPTLFQAGDSTIGAAITTAGFVTYTGPYRWVNLRLGTGATGGGTVGANMQTITP